MGPGTAGHGEPQIEPGQPAEKQLIQGTQASPPTTQRANKTLLTQPQPTKRSVRSPSHPAMQSFVIFVVVTAPLTFPMLDSSTIIAFPCGKDAAL